MQKFCKLLVITSLFVAAPAFSEPGGCLKYGAAGALGGHVANHHTVLGAVGGCTAGMYRRHEYKKTLKEKAALWDKEHISEPGGHKSWWQGNMSKEAIIQKAQWYDVEHPESDKGKMLDK